MDRLKNGNGERRSSTAAKCALCGQAFDRTKSQTMPFCSRRCQQIDLGRWLDEEYGLPIERSDDGFGDGPAEPLESD